MFLFLSKLLPLFIYPLGLTCLLLTVSLITFWKRPRIAAATIALALTVLLLGSNAWVTGWLVRSLEWQYLPIQPLPTAEAIVVLGGGTKPPAPPRPGVDLGEGGDRIFYGAQLYREGKAPKLILSGGRIGWQGSQQPESEDMAEIATLLGVPPEDILQDSTSLNTYQNAVNVKEILETEDIQKILLVTSAMHMPRALAIFRHQDIEAIPAPTDFLATRSTDLVETAGSGPVSLPGILLGIIPDVDRLRDTSRALKEYIGMVIYRLRGWL